MPTQAQVEQILGLLRESNPEDCFKKMNETSMGVGAVLMYLRKAQEPVSAGQISHGLNVSTARVAVLLKKMEGRELLVTGSSPTDARMRVVRLSQRGEKAAARLEEELYEQTAYLIERVGMERLIEFASISGEIQTVLSELRGRIEGVSKEEEPSGQRTYERGVFHA